MDFEVSYTPEQEQFRIEVRRWFAKHVPPGLGQTPASPEASYENYLQRRTLGRELGARGWLYPMAPKAYGGGGLDVDHAIILEEEANRLHLSLPPYYDSGGRLGSAAILVWGTEAQKRTFLPPIFTGKVRTWQLLTEPEAGSDLANVQMTAVRDQDHYILDGQKIFVGSDHGTDWLWTLAVTAPQAPRHHNLGWFMVDAHLPGITIRPQNMLSARGEGDTDYGHKNTVFFDHVRVPCEALIGGENEGWKVATTHLELEHGGGGAVGRPRVWDHLLRYCQETERDGKPLIQDPDVRDRLTEIYMRLEIGRLFNLRNFWLTYTHQPRSYEGPQASYHHKMTGLWMTRQILEALGPWALTNDPVLGMADGLLELQQREGIVAVHPGGTADIQCVIMARRIGIGRDDREQAGTVL